MNLLSITTSVFKEADTFKVTKPENFLKSIYSTEMSCPQSKFLGSVAKAACQNYTHLKCENLTFVVALVTQSTLMHFWDLNDAHLACSLCGADFHLSA